MNELAIWGHDSRTVVAPPQQNPRVPASLRSDIVTSYRTVHDEPEWAFTILRIGRSPSPESASATITTGRSLVSSMRRGYFPIWSVRLGSQRSPALTSRGAPVASDRCGSPLSIVPPAPIDDRQARARRAPAPIRDMSEPSSTPSGDSPHRTRPTCSRGVDSAGFGPLGWPDRLAKQRRAADPGRCLVRTARFRGVAARLAGPAARWTQCSRQAPAGLATSIGRTAVSSVTAGLGHGPAPAGTDPLPRSPRRTTAARPAR